MKETDDVDEGIKSLLSISFNLSRSMIKEEHDAILYTRLDRYKK